VRGGESLMALRLPKRVQVIALVLAVGWIIAACGGGDPYEEETANEDEGDGADFDPKGVCSLEEWRTGRPCRIGAWANW
jgi:hypothetical protein